MMLNIFLMKLKDKIEYLLKFVIVIRRVIVVRPPKLHFYC